MGLNKPHGRHDSSFPRRQDGDELRLRHYLGTLPNGCRGMHRGGKTQCLDRDRGVRLRCL